MTHKKPIKQTKKKSVGSRKSISYIYLPIIIFLSLINSIRATLHQYYILQYGDDIVWVHWIMTHISTPLSLLSHGPGNGYRPTMNILYALGYSLWGANEAGYYILNGILLTGAMIFFYLTISLLYSKNAAFISTLFFLFLDATFILVWKINYIASLGEIFFITASIYFSIKYFHTYLPKHLILSILLAILAFFNKEPSIVIIPTVNIIYILHNYKIIFPHSTFRKLYVKLSLFICALPVIILFLLNIFTKTEVGITQEPLLSVIYTKAVFYLEQEMVWQFKNSYLIFLAFSSTILCHKFEQGKYNILKTTIPIITVFITWFLLQINQLYTIYGFIFAIILFVFAFIFSNLPQRIGLGWFAIAFSPLLISALIVQPTYLAEANLGMCLFLGITLIRFSSHLFTKNNKEPLFHINMVIFVIVVLLLQPLALIAEISNTNGYHNRISDNQATFKDSVNYINTNVPINATVYYIPDELHNNEQITVDMFQKMLCIKGRCDINALPLTNNVESEHYIALISTLDIYLFENNYKELLPSDLYSSRVVFKNGEDQAMILKVK